MTRNDQLESIRFACLKANPERMEIEMKHGPIRLADVLLAIASSDNEKYTAISEFGHFLSLTDRMEVGDVNVCWNLRHDDLTQQSDECITFLADRLNGR